MINNFIKKHQLNLIGILIGGTAGYLYYFLVSCASGNCMITSNPIITVPYFAFLGYLLVGLLKRNKSKVH